MDLQQVLRWFSTTAEVYGGRRDWDGGPTRALLVVFNSVLPAVLGIAKAVSEAAAGRAIGEEGLRLVTRSSLRRRLLLRWLWILGGGMQWFWKWQSVEP